MAPFYWLGMSPHLRKRLEVPNKFPSQEKIIVLGGTGCVGERICKHATHGYYNVWSLSKNFPYSFPNIVNRLFHPMDDAKPWPQFMTWRKFDVLQPFDDEDLFNDIYGATTMFLCIGGRKPPLLNFNSIQQEEGQYVSNTGYRGQLPHPGMVSSSELFEEHNVRSIERSLVMAKAINIRNFIYISVSGVFPIWTKLFDKRFLSYKRRGEKILEGIHYSVDGTPINMAILRPVFIYTERRPILSALALIHSSLFPNSFGSTNLTADRVARCALKVAAEFKRVHSKRNHNSARILQWTEPDKWVLEDQDMFRLLEEHERR